MTITHSLAPALAAALVCSSAQADVKLAAIFGDHMVLQEGKKVPFWGTADPGEVVTVSAAGATGETTADTSGRWKVEIGPVEAREPFDVTVRGRNNVTLTDVVTGEVWIASGQSNMEWPVHASARAPAEMEQAGYPRLRLFRVEKPPTFSETRTDVEGRWSVSSPASVARFSAVGYFFGRALVTALGRPIGVVQTAWGGTTAEAWTSRKALAADPKLRHLLALAPGASGDAIAATREYEDAVARARRDPAREDPGNEGLRRGWAAAALNTDAWDTMVLPAGWENEGLPDLDGAVWFRREVSLPPAWVGKALTLYLGPVSDCDVAYVGGAEVGATCRETENLDLWPRRYAVRAELVRAARLAIAVRVFDRDGPGGFLGGRDDMRLVLGDSFDGPAISLRGDWRYQVEARLPAAPDRPRPRRPPNLRTSNTPGVLHETMLAALAPFAIRGAIWYQGESNTRRAYQYRTLFPALIQDWRRTFGQGAFPFLFAQLSSYHRAAPEPGGRGEDEWPELREAQQLALKLPNTGMAVTIDVGDRNDIHPRNKQQVGRRLSLVALSSVYGQVVAHSGPTYIGHAVEKGRIRLRFDHARGMAVQGRGPLRGFEVAGRDRRFVAAEARIDGNTVTVSAPTIAAPVAARYAWTDAPAANLVNEADLPAAPFRTDRWPGLTDRRK